MVIFRVYVNLPEGMMMNGRIDELMLNLLTVFHDILKTVARKLPIGRWQPPTFSHLLRVLDTSQYLPSTWDDFGWLNVDSCQVCGQIRSNLTPSDSSDQTWFGLAASHLPIALQYFTSRCFR